MKKSLLVLLVLVVAGVVLFTFLRTDPERVGDPLAELSTYSNNELGIEFQYPAGEEGYTVQEIAPTVPGDGLIRTIVVARTEDLDNIPEGGEGPPTITIQIFENTQNQWPQVWADEHIQYSNINLLMGDVSEDVIGGANAVRYMADGLYASDMAVVAHGENIYVFNGMFMDQDSAIRGDFQPLLDSVRFIPTPTQE